MAIVKIFTDDGVEVSTINTNIYPCFKWPDSRNIYDRLAFESAIYRSLNLAELEEKSAMEESR